MIKLVFLVWPNSRICTNLHSMLMGASANSGALTRSAFMGVSLTSINSLTSGGYSWDDWFIWSPSASLQMLITYSLANSMFLSKGWPLFRKPAFPLIYRARLGRRFEVNGNVKARVAEMECYYRETLAAGASIHGKTNR